MIGWFKTASDVGLYSAVYRIIQVLYILPSVLSTSSLPTFSRLAKLENEKMKTLLERLLAFVFLFSLPLAVCGTLLAKSITVGLFGSAYAAAASSFQILLVTVIVDFSAVILINVAFAYDKQRSLIIYSALGGGFNILFDIFFIPRFGIIGSAWATLLAQIISNYYLWSLVKKHVPFSIFPNLKKIAVATVATGLFTLAMILLKINFIITIALAVPLYVWILYVLKEPLLWELKSLLPSSAAALPAEIATE